MTDDPRQRFQGKCLQSTEGHTWMRTHYDQLPESVRARLASSAYNLCAACVTEIAQSKNSTQPRYIETIEQMENQIREEEKDVYRPLVTGPSG